MAINYDLTNTGPEVQQILDESAEHAAAIEQLQTGKQDVIEDLEDIRYHAMHSYEKPVGGIPKSDLSIPVAVALDRGSSAYQLPSGGIPKGDLASAVQTSLGKADTAIQEVKTINGESIEGSGNINVATDISGKVDKTTTVNGHALSSNVTVTKGDVGLGNVTNDAQIPLAQKGVAGGVASLGSDGKVPRSQLPYIDISGKADKATTLAGYGITDGYTKAEGQALEADISAKKEEIDTTMEQKSAEINQAILLNRAEINAAQLEIGAVQTDEKPTQGSANHLTSGAVYSAIEGLDLKKLEEVSFVRRRFNFRSLQTTVNEVATLPDYLAGIKLEVKPGDVVYLTATGEWDYSTWCFADSDKKTLTWSTAANTPCDNTKLVAPSNAKYFYANTVKAVEGHCWVEVSRLDNIENHNSQQDDVINETISIVNGVANDTSGLLSTIPFLFKTRFAYNDVAALNIDKESMLYALGWYASKKGSIYDSVSYGKRVKRLTFGWITDIHGDTERFRRFMEYCNRYSDVIDAVLITGDMNVGSDIDYGWMETIGKFYKDFNMPILPILGNHDMAGDIITQSGNNGNVVASGSHENNDSYLFSPYIPSGAVKGPGSYYYLDFPEAKIRVIVLFEYELPIRVNCTAFEPLTDAEQEAINAGTLSYKNIVRGKSYSTGEILHYKGLYFKAKNDNRFNDIYGTGVWASTPISQYSLWAKYFSQTQCDWLIASLKMTPQNYNVIVCSHGPIDFVETTPVDENWQTSNFAKNLGFSQNGYVLQDILSAFNNKSSINKTYKAIAPTTTPLSQNVTFINDLGNHYPDVVVNDDLSSTNGKAIAYLHGHWHADMNFFSGAMSGGARILNIGNTCGVADSANYLSDLNRGGNKSQDAFNIISFDTYNQTIQLLRIGADVNDQMKQRLYTQLNY